MRRSAPLLVLLAATFLGCGGKVVFVEDDGEGGASAQGGNGGTSNPSVTTNSSTNSSTSTSTSTGTIGVGGGGPGLVEEVVQEGVTVGTISLDATAGTLGITALATSDNGSAEIRFNQLRAPSGSVVVDGFVPSNTYEWSWFGALGIGTPQVDHPETFPLAQGSWSFDFQSSTPARVGLWRRSTIDGAFHGGVLDINIFSPNGLLAESETLDALTDAYNDWAGIELGNVTFYTINDAYFVVNDENLFQLLEESKVAETRPALNIMATGSIEGQLEGAAGFSVGIPGVGMWHGTHASAIVWMVSGGGFDPIIMRHEAAHFSGLFHTTEFAVGFNDPLADTPVCADATALNSECPDYDYIMFPTGGSGAGLFSPQEKKVIQGGSLYRGIFAPGEQPMTAYGPPLDAQGSGRRASEEALGEARARSATRTRTRAIDAPWAQRFDRSTATTLAGIGCPVGAESDYFAQLSAAGVRGPDAQQQMLELAQDPSAPAFVRRRAALMLGRLLEQAPDAAYLAPLEALTRSVSESDLVRSAALRALARFSRADAEIIAADLTAETDRHLARAVAELQ